MKHRRTIALCAAVLLAALVVVGVAYAHGQPADPQITLCHANPPDTAANGWNLIAIDDDGIQGSSHDGQHGADIIPAFSWQEWEETGEVCTWGSWHNGHGGDEERTVPATYLPSHVEHRHGSGSWNDGPCHGGGTCTTRTRTDEVDVAEHTEHRHLYCEDVYGWVTYNYPGKNLTTLFGWGATGAEVLANGCVLPPPPYEACDETVAGQAQNDIVGEWSVWVYDPAFGTETRSQEVTTYSEPLLDAHDPTIICTPSVPTTRTETEVRDYTACQDGLIATPGEWSA